MRGRISALCGGLVVVACVLSACTATTSAAGTASLAELDDFRGGNGLLSNIAAESFVTSSVADTAYAVRIDRLMHRDLRNTELATDGDRAPSVDRWRQLWQDDSDEPLWKAHSVCSVLGPGAARAVAGAEVDAIVADARAESAPLARMDEASGSLDALAALHVAWCLAGDDPLAGRTQSVEPILAAVSSNSALALQWVDVLAVMGRPSGRIEVASTALEGVLPDECDDRTSLEAAAALILAPSTATPALERCAIDDALDSDDPQVLLSALRAALRDGMERPDAARAIATVVGARRAPDGTHRRPARVSGSLNGTLAGLRLLTAGDRAFGDAEAAEVLDVMTREARTASGDALLVLAACATLRRTCGALVEPGLRAGAAVAADTAHTAAALDGLLTALALARPADPQRVDAIVASLADRPFRGCARAQIAVFREVAAAGTWPPAARESARTDVREAARSADLTGYCDLSWAARLATGGDETVDDVPLAVDAEGRLRWGDQPAPLTIAAAAADLGLYERNPSDD